MQLRFMHSLILAVAVPALGASAQPVTRPASNIAPSDVRSVVAPALPVPPVPSADPPAAFLSAARTAVARGRTGEAQEALERAETRLLDRGLPSGGASAPDNRQAVLAIGAARRALAAHDTPAAIAAIDDALAAAGPPASQASAMQSPAVIVAPAAPSPPVAQPVITQALRPGHWALHGARYVWVPPETTLHRVQSAGLVPGAYVWLDGAYVWVPPHDAAPP